MKPEPFHLEISQWQLDDLADRLSRTRWPDEPSLEPWSTGTSLEYLQGLASYWEHDFDWRAQEARINRFRQYRAKIRGVDLHFIHEPGRGKNPMPLLLSHGWPGSIVEFLELIPLLTEHFTIVAPSLPGFTLSHKPGQPRMGLEEIAEVFADLMTLLGYDKFGAQGGDWGAFITARLAAMHPERLTGIHLNLLPLRRDLNMVANPTPEEKEYLDQLGHWMKEGMGYQWIQGTRPQTLAYGLTDSPAGLAGWIADKFQAWSDCDGVIENAIPRDTMLANISLYWFTGAIGSSFWPYYARMHRPWPIPDGKTIDVPMGYAAFPKEILRPPRSMTEKTFRNIRLWTTLKKGGHFAALENPQVLAMEIRKMFNQGA